MFFIITLVSEIMFVLHVILLRQAIFAKIKLFSSDWWKMVYFNPFISPLFEILFWG